MRTLRSTTIMVALTMTMASLVACGNSKSVQGQSGLSGLGSSSPASVAPSLAPTPTATATGHGSGTGGGHPTGGTTTTSGSTPSVPGSPSATRTFRTINPPLRGNYTIVVVGPCYWALDSDDDGDLIVGTSFKITHTGIFATSTVPFRLTNSIDIDNSTSPGEPLNTVFAAAVGGPGTNTTYPGHLVTVTGTITPSGSDTNAADNAISIGIQVPAASSGLPTSTTPVTIPCVG